MWVASLEEGMDTREGNTKSNHEKMRGIQMHYLNILKKQSIYNQKRSYFALVYLQSIHNTVYIKMLHNEKMR